MCGIGGFYKAGAGPVPVEAIKSLWVALEGRGRHAAGFALQWEDSDSPVVFKKKGPASRHLTKIDHFAGNGKNVKYTLLHTRFTTQGSVDYNGNNHPVVSHGMIVTHNGVLWNDGDIFSDLQASRLHQVDTEAINASLSLCGPGWTADNVRGSMSIAWVDEETPETVFLMTNGNNPLVIGRTTDGHVVWASTKEILEQSDFVMSNVFHAMPFKLYSVSGDGAIRSRFVSDQRAEPDIPWQMHAAQRTYRGEWGFGTPKPKKKPRKGRKASKKIQVKQLQNRVSKKVQNDLEDYLLVQGWIKDKDGDWRYVE